VIATSYAEQIADTVSVRVPVPLPPTRTYSVPLQPPPEPAAVGNEFSINALEVPEPPERVI
jgi:hypothetical protein